MNLLPKIPVDMVKRIRIAKILVEGPPRLTESRVLIMQF